jgi:NADH dehydrogenase
LAGAFAEIKNNILPKDYPDIDFTHFKINLIEGSKDTLNSMSFQPKELQKNIFKKWG